VSDQLEQATDRLSSMADKVAGFGISTALILTWGSFKDLAPSIEAHRLAFVIATIAGGCMYIGAVIYLYYAEGQLRAPEKRVINDGDKIHQVNRLLALARCVGVALFTGIAVTAIIGAGSQP
jgi:hypothetical protein